MESREFYLANSEYPVEKEDWIWMPHAAHYICSDSCLFRMATVVGDFIVSTVGEYYPYRGIKDSKMKEIGFGRFYETMVFYKRKTEFENFSCCEFSTDGEDIEMIPYHSSEKAFNGHMEACYKYSKMKKVKINHNKTVIIKYRDGNELREFLHIGVYSRNVDAIEAAMIDLKNHCNYSTICYSIVSIEISYKGTKYEDAE